LLYRLRSTTSGDLIAYERLIGDITTAEVEIFGNIRQLHAIPRHSLYAGLGLLLGLPLPLLFWGGLAVPFVAAGLAARFWPLLRTIGLDLLERSRHRHKFWTTEQHGGGAQLIIAVVFSLRVGGYKI
jgi:hypothetical protein